MSFRRIILVISFSLGIAYSFAQQYQVDLTTSGNFTSQQFYSAATFASVTGPFGSWSPGTINAYGQGTTILTGKITGVQLLAGEEYFDGNGIQTYVCNQVEDHPVTIDDCGTYSFGFPSSCNGYGQVDFTITPILAATTGTSPATYCEGQSISLNASPGFGSYTWQYIIQGGGWTPFAVNNNSSITITLADIFGANVSPNLKKNIFFGYSVGGCNAANYANSTQTGPFYFVASNLSAASASVSAPTCTNGGDGSITFSLNRPLLSGETFDTFLYSAPDISSSLLANGATGSTTITMPSGTYHLLIASSDGNCGSAQFLAVTIPAGPRTPISASASVTSFYSGYSVSCPGSNNGQITVNASGGNSGPYYYSLDTGPDQTSNIFSTVTAGNHTVTVKDTCPTPSTVTTNTVSLNQPGAINVTSVNPSLCNTGSSGQIIISASGGAGSLSYSIDNGISFQSSGSFAGLSANTYSVVIKDVNNCTVPGGSPTIPNPIIPGSVSVTQPICFGGNGSISLSGSSGGTGALTWSIDGASQAATPFQALNLSFNASADTYITTVKDANNCTATVTPNMVIINPAPIGVSNTIVNPSCFAGSDGKITVTASNGISPYSFSKDGGANFQAVGNNVFNSGIVAGSYSMVVKDSQGCLSTVSTAIVGQPTQVTGTIPPPAPFSCFSTSNSATLDLTPSGGTGPYTYLWNTSATTEDINVTLGSSLSTNYSVTITDSKLCSTSRNITVTQPTLLTNTISPTNISCFGANDGTVNLTPTGGTLPYTFLWNNGAITEDLSARPAGTYSVTITDNNGCTSSASTSITEPTQLTVTQGTTTNIICFGQSNGTTILNASGGTPSYEYSRDGTNWQSSPLITGLALNSNLLRVRDAKLCPAQITVNITQPPLLSVSVSNIIDASCGLSNGSAMALGSGGTGSYVFEWRDVSNNVVSSAANLTGIPGGVFRVTLTDQNGCTDFHDTPIASPNGPQIAINSLTATQCSYSDDGGASIHVTAGQSPYAVTWNNGETGNNPVALKPGVNVNFVTVTDAAGCVAAKAVNVPSPAALSISVISAQLPTCPAGTDGSIHTSASGGTGTLTYQWNTGVNSNILSNIKAGTYQLSVKDVQNCLANTSIVLADKPSIVIQSTTISPPTCSGSSDGVITANAAGGNGSFTYSWDNGATGPTLSAVKAGSYILTAKDGSGCTSQQSFILNDPPLLKIDLGPDRKICQGGSYRISSPVASPTYLWTSSNGFTSSASTVTLTQGGTYTLQVINSSGCKATDSFDLVTVTDLLKADFLIAPEAFETDTVVVIDISWPIPESTSWRLPQSAVAVTQNSDFVELVFPTAGTYTVTLDAALASCQSSHSENIVIRSGSRPKTGGRAAGEALIKSAKLYPNPNIGEFFVEVLLSQSAPVEMNIVSLYGNRTVAIFSANSTGEQYVWPLQLMTLQPGIYIVVIKAGNESKSIQFVKL